MKNGEEPAHPTIENFENGSIGCANVDGYKGLTKREYFAIECLKAILSNRELQLAIYKDLGNKGLYPDSVTNENVLQFDAIQSADVLLLELEKK